jgi:hypothetical protein
MLEIKFDCWSGAMGGASGGDTALRRQSQREDDDRQLRRGQHIRYVLSKIFE